MDQNRPLRWGFLSTGYICHDFCTAMSTLKGQGHVAIAVGGRSISSAKEFALKHGIPKAYGQYDQLYSDPDIDIVYIGTINPYHLSTAKAALNAGKHVLVEKPLGMNAKEVQELVTLAKDKGLFLMEGIWSRCFPAYAHLKDLVDKEVIGQVKNLLVTFGSASARERVAKKELGGGGLLDKGIYSIQLVTHLFGAQMPSEILSYGILNDEGVDKNLSTTFVYSEPEGKLATLLVSTQVKMDNKAILYGTKGTITIDNFWCPLRIDCSIPDLDMSKEFPLPQTDGLVFNFTNSSGFVYEILEVGRCISQGLQESPLLPLSETLLIAKIMDKIRLDIGVIYPQD